MEPSEYSRLRKRQNEAHKRLTLLRKIAAPKRTGSTSDEMVRLEAEMAANQLLLNSLRRKRKRTNSKLKKLYAREQKATTEKIEQGHKLSKIDEQRISLVQGGAPGLGKGKS